MKRDEGLQPNSMLRSRTQTLAAWGAAVWAGLFGLVHLYWAFGGSLGLPRGIVLAERPALLFVDLAAIPMCGAAAAIAVRLATRGGAAERRLSWAALAIAAFCLIHALPPLIDAAARWSTGRLLLSEPDRYALFLYEPYWALGGLLFAGAGWRGGR